MNKTLKYTGIIIIVIILAVIVAGIVVVNTINPNRFKPFISKQVYKFTGRKLSFNGNLAWSLLPLGFKVNQITLSNAKNFGNQAFLSLNHASIAIKLLPLLFGKVSISQFAVNGLHLHLMQNQAGQNNWTFVQAGRKTNDANNNHPTNQTKTNTHPWSFILPMVNIKNATITWDNASNNQHIILNNISINAKNVQANQLFPVNISISVNSRHPSIKGQVRLNTHVLFNTHGKHYQLVKLKLTSHLLGNNVPNHKLAIAAQGNIMLSSHNIAIKPFNLKLNDSNILGNLNVNIKNNRHSAINFSAKIDKLDLDPYFAASNGSSHQSKSSNHHRLSVRQNDHKHAQITWADILRSLTIQGLLQIDKLTVMKAKLAHVNIKATTHKGIITIAPIRATLYRGHYNGTIIINTNKKLPIITATSQLKHLAIKPLLYDTYHLNHISGTASFDTAIKAHGITTDSLINSLNGKLDFAIINGRLVGVDIGYYINVLAALIKKQPAPKQTNHNSTDFGSLKGQVAINHGIATSDNLQLRSPMVTVSGQGSVNLSKQTVKAVLYANLAATKDSKRPVIPALPIKISGTLKELTLTPDYKQVLAQLVQQQLKEKVQEGISSQLQLLKTKLLG